MITAVSLNPSIDLTLSIDGFVYGGLNRVHTAQSDAGGKGMNVALAAARLNAAARCIGFIHQKNADEFETKLRENGADFDFVALPGGARTNIKLRDDQTGQITEINQSGGAVTADDLLRIEALVKKHAAAGGFMVFSGSLPPGCPADFYQTLIEIVSRAGCRCALDADGARLTAGIEAKPYLIKPNRFELESMAGRALADATAICAAAREIIDRGVSVVAVSLGAEGALIVDRSQALYACALDVEVQSTVGAGDSMVAALAAGFDAGKPLEEAFRMGVACSAAACMTEGTRTFDHETYTRLLPRVAIERVGGA
ncbi:MAG: 1-phosphofructokinase [Christensenellales bacterium]|jgi:1-phosphofructokinase